MTDEQLQQIRERAQKATPEPWESVSGSVAGYPVYSVGSKHTGIAQLISSEYNAPDADFIAHAREDIPALLAEVERMREIVQAVANLDLMWTGEPHLRYCAFCGAHIMAYEDLSEFKHTPDCSVIKARALLAKTGGE